MRLIPVTLIAAFLLVGCGSSSSGPTATVAPRPESTGHLVPPVVTTNPRLPTVPPQPTATAIPAAAFTATLRGTVTDAKTGSPIAGATVLIAGGVKTVRTRAFGDYTVRFPAGPATPVTVTVNGFAGGLAVGRLRPHQTYTLNFKLNPQTGNGAPLPAPPIQFGQR